MIESARGGPPRAGVTESTVEDTTFKWLKDSVGRCLLPWYCPACGGLGTDVLRVGGSGDPAERRSASIESKVCPARSWTTTSGRTGRSATRRRSARPRKCPCSHLRRRPSSRSAVEHLCQTQFTRRRNPGVNPPATLVAQAQSYNGQRRRGAAINPPTAWRLLTQEPALRNPPHTDLASKVIATSIK